MDRPSSSSIHSSQSPLCPVPDMAFFYEPVYIEVSGTLFCVPREYLDVPGTTFAQMFIDGTPSHSDTIAEGSHRSNPIHLDFIGVGSFRSFLKGAWRRNSVNISRDDWVAILCLAHLWNFTTLKKEAQENIETGWLTDPLWEQDPGFFINFGRKLYIKEWIVKGYTILADPSYSLGSTALSMAGLTESQAIKLFRIREAVIQHQCRKHKDCSTCRQSAKFDLSANSRRSGVEHGRRSQPRHTTVEIAHCDCGDSIYAGYSNYSWGVVANALIEVMFKDELRKYEAD
ncbi:hypothetical protein CVT24_001202 [Panaeolus cyanescens]|uniref:BTB domain-containing protein n=1 Tax=Panaeolus cyanescens TaxID=181874 RepID=A0A409VTU8_9AGAR|nr:hypothetical protein CVT24_001202 [Panaeolus cyanescens]